MNGQSGTDTLSYGTATSAVTVDLGAGKGWNGDAQGDVFYGFENVTGGSGSDRLTGSSLANLIRGGAGNDGMVGLAGADSLVGGTGIDTVNYSASSSGITLRLDSATGSEIHAIGSGGDAAGDYVTGVENIIGSNFNDKLGLGFSAGQLFGLSVNDTLDGSTGKYTIDVGSGNDIVRAGSGNDVIFGGAGNDTISGDFGNDVISGNAGADVFDFTLGLAAGQQDRIKGLEDGADLFRFSSAESGDVTVSNVADGAEIAVAVDGGIFSIIVEGFSAAQVSDQIVFV